MGEQLCHVSWIFFLSPLGILIWTKGYLLNARFDSISRQNNLSTDGLWSILLWSGRKKTCCDVTYSFSGRVLDHFAHRADEVQGSQRHSVTQERLRMVSNALLPFPLLWTKVFKRTIVLLEKQFFWIWWGENPQSLSFCLYRLLKLWESLV